MSICQLEFRSFERRRTYCLAQTINIRHLTGVKPVLPLTGSIRTPGRVRFQPKTCSKKPRTYEIATQKVEPGQVHATFARSAAARIRRSIFPEADFGICAINSILRILLCGATRSATNSIISSAVAAPFNTTKAFGTSPDEEAGEGMTAASATRGCVNSTASS